MRPVCSPTCPLCWQRDYVPVPAARLDALELIAARVVERLLDVIHGTTFTDVNVAGEVWFDEDEEDGPG